MIRQCFNDGWKFSEGAATTLDALFAATAGAPEILKGEVTLPHDAMIHTKREDFYAGTCSAFYKPKNVFYTKTFSLNPEDEGKVFWLEFEGVMQYAFVYVNGSMAGRCMYGHGCYYIDITKYVVFDKSNTIQVNVKNGLDAQRWYLGGGIYRDVNLIIGNPVHVKCEGTRITTISADSDCAVVEVLTPVDYTGCSRKKLTVLTEFFDLERNLVVRDTTPLTLLEPCEREARQRIHVYNPKIWDLNHPNLYKCRTTLLQEDEILDIYETHFGIRTIQVDAAHGFRLNGKTIKLKGGCIHNDGGVIGAATFDDTEYRRIRKLKESGFNLVRGGAKPVNRAVLDACDRLGMLVLDEFFDVWETSKVAFDYAFIFKDNWQTDMKNIVLRNYNHPSVIMYSVGCEIQSLGKDDVIELCKVVTNKLREFDSTRFVSFAMNFSGVMADYMADIFTGIFQKQEEIQETGEASAEMQEPTLKEEDFVEINSTMNQANDWMSVMWDYPLTSYVPEEACAQVDVVGYSYASEMYERDHEKFPNRVIMGTECYPRNLAKNWELVEKHSYVIGDIAWCAWDYLGEGGIGDVDHNAEPKPATAFYGNWPWRQAYVGIFNLIGDKNPIGYWRDFVWKNRTVPYISVRPPQYYGRPTNPTTWSWISDSHSCWNWPGYEGKPIEVEVFSKAKEVELFVNGKSVGKMPTGMGLPYLSIFKTVYEPGEIKVVDSDGEEFILLSAKDDNHLKVYVDPVELANKNRDLTFIEVSLCDEDGVLNAFSSKKVHVEIEGAGTIQGFGSANPKSTESFDDRDVAAFQGRLLAVVRHDKTGGKVRVTFQADGCKEVIVQL